MPDLIADVPARVLAVYAHPNDPEISCGATLARWAAAGAEVHVVVCTRGEKGTVDPAVLPEELALRREREGEESARVLGLAGREQLGFDDGEIDDLAMLRRRLVAVIRRLRPDVVVCPDPTAVFFGDRYYNHRDHRAVGWATLDAVSPDAGHPHYVSDAGPIHRVTTVLLSGTLEPNAWVDVDVDDALETKVQALLCHASQLEGPEEWVRTVVRQRSEEGGREASVGHAEAFRRLTLGS
ncbi:MAG: PIG-L deacetylase family protein [Acidimicrobiales bacterium]